MTSFRIASSRPVSPTAHSAPEAAPHQLIINAVAQERWTDAEESSQRVLAVTARTIGTIRPVADLLSAAFAADEARFEHAKRTVVSSVVDKGGNIHQAKFIGASAAIAASVVATDMHRQVTDRFRTPGGYMQTVVPLTRAMGSAMLTEVHKHIAFTPLFEEVRTKAQQEAIALERALLPSVASPRIKPLTPRAVRALLSTSHPRPSTPKPHRTSRVDKPHRWRKEPVLGRGLRLLYLEQQTEIAREAVRLKTSRERSAMRFWKRLPQADRDAYLQRDEAKS